MYPLLSLDEARAAGLTRYFTGRPCPHGHLAERYTASRGCVECQNLASKRWNRTNPAKHSATVRRWEKENPDKKRANDQRLRRRHSEKRKALNKRWREANAEKRKTDNKRWREINREKWLANMKAWRRAHPEKGRAKMAFRRHREVTPSWIDRAAVQAIYDNCPLGMEVDHIVPLKGRTIEGYRVSGLHVPWNLQYLPTAENTAKGNRMRPEDQALLID